MLVDKNERDIELLRKSPKELIISFQNLIEIIINQFIKSGKFSQAEQPDIIQQVNEELLKKINKIQQQFNNQSLVRTYMTVVIRNICNDIYRAKRKNIEYLCDRPIAILDNTTDIINSMIIKEEINRLHTVINLYHKQKYKLQLCLKLYFRIPFEFKDFMLIDNRIKVEEYDKFLKDINPYQSCNDYTIFNALILIFNALENKENKPDALRKWINLKIDEIISLLNGNTNMYFYTKETLQMLFEYCFVPKNLQTKVYQ
jgi:hypothetical protein